MMLSWELRILLLLLFLLCHTPPGSSGARLVPRSPNSGKGMGGTGAAGLS